MFRKCEIDTTNKCACLVVNLEFVDRLWQVGLDQKLPDHAVPATVGDGIELEALIEKAPKRATAVSSLNRVSDPDVEKVVEVAEFLAEHSIDRTLEMSKTRLARMVEQCSLDR